MLVVALTGGFCSGKSTVAKFFSELNIPVIDADEISHELTKKNTPTAAKIINHFGNHIVYKTGDIHREQLRDIVFKNSEEKKWLEDLLHPLILSEIQSRLKKIQAPYTLVVIPLLAETTIPSFIKKIIVVDANESLQISRAKKRHLNDQQIQRILNSQTSRKHRLSLADHIIVNNGSLSELRQQVSELDKKLRIY